jgi:hypothetical protein
VVIIAVLSGVLLWPAGRPANQPTASHPVAATALVDSAATSASTSLQVPVEPTAPAATPNLPTRVTVARLGIDSPLEPLGLLADGSLQSPTKWQEAGWYAEGVRPGAIGPAVIAGHVDSVTGPAVFYRLREMRVGDDITVTDAGGSARHFTVTDVKEYPKTAFPTAEVYGPTVLPVLRLVTCTGDFDYKARSYLDNLVVSAALQQPAAY